MSVINYIYSLGPWLWLVLAVALFGLETTVPGVHFLWFGFAALATGLLGLGIGMPLQWQLVVFALLSITFVLLARRYVVSGSAPTDLPSLNQRGAEYVGRIVPVEEAIRGGRGKVRVGDTLWIAEGPEAPVGSRVRITGSSGTVLNVEPA